MIRKATLADVPRLVELIVQFITTTDYKDYVRVNSPQIRCMYVRLVQDNNSVVFVSEVDDKVIGLIAMVKYNHPLSGDLVAGELAWWVEPVHRGHGIELFKAAEKWSHDNKVSSIAMTAPTGNPVEGFYRRQGYTQIETAFQKDLCYPC
jgi:GNAT superfamily N-acetyltransferase